MAESSANDPAPSHADNKLSCHRTETGHESGDNAGTKEDKGSYWGDTGIEEILRKCDETTGELGNAGTGTR